MPICSQSLLFSRSHMPASLQPAELRHDTAVSGPLNKDSLSNQIYPPCHFPCHLIICLYFLAALMQSFSTVIIESLWLDTSQSWTDLLVFACFSSPFPFDQGKAPVLCQPLGLFSSLLDAEDLENLNVLSSPLKFIATKTCL